MALQLTPAQEQSFEHLAQVTGRPVNELVEEVISSYLDEIEMRTAEVREAEESAERDEWLTTDEVFAGLNLRKTA
jgi:predicted transcriptional regulator